MSQEEGNQPPIPEKVYRPQHFRTVEADVVNKPRLETRFRSEPTGLTPLATQWPKEWVENPELIKLVSEHQNWLGNVVTQKLREVLANRRQMLVNAVANAADNSTFDDSQVRVAAAQLKQLLEIEKVIYDTEKFVESIIG